jgi:hypothetical protein
VCHVMKKVMTSTHTRTNGQDSGSDRLVKYKTVAPDVPRWREQETLAYVERTEANLARMDADGRVVR